MMLKLVASSAAFLSIVTPAYSLDASAQTCHACMAATFELRKAVPSLSRSTTSAEDKELALGDAVGSACAGYNFAGLEGSSELADACRALMKGGEWPAVQAALVAGSEPVVACAGPCAAIPENSRAPPTAAPRVAKIKAKTDKDGTVEDPAYKAVRVIL